MEKMETELTFAEYDPDLFRLFGITDNSGISFTLRGGMQGTGNAESVVINLRGIITELDAGTWKAGEKSTLKCIIAAHYYKLTIDNRGIIEIDAENMVRKINGTDQLSSLRSAIGI
jgi:P2 family phage contractile tail tube protein